MKLRVHVIEIQGIVAVFVGHLQEHVQVGAAGRDEERRLVLDNRSLGKKLGRQQTDGTAVVVVLSIAVTRADIEYRRGSAAKLGREQTLVEHGIVERIVIEHREQAHHVTRTIDGSSVKKNGILRGRSATHLEARQSVGLAFHTGQ